MTGVWFIQSTENPEQFWSRADGWGEADGADEYTDDEKAAATCYLPTYMRWVEGVECDCCGEMRPEWGGEGHMGYYSSASIDPPDTWWCCQYCKDNQEGTY